MLKYSLFFHNFWLYLESKNGKTMNKIDITDILHQFKGRREQLNLSQKDMADKLNISQVSYSKIESGKTALTVETFFSICDILKIDLFAPKQNDTEKPMIAITEQTITEQTVTVANLANELIKVGELLKELATKQDVENILSKLNELKK